MLRVPVNLQDTMETQHFVIKSLWVQNSVMILSVGLILLFLLWALSRRKPRHSVAAIVWLGIALWFFNSPFFGFSTVAVNPEGITIDYGILSIKNGRVPITTPWQIISSPTGIRKLKKVHLIKIGNHESMKVRGMADLNLLKKIGAAIDESRKVYLRYHENGG